MDSASAWQYFNTVFKRVSLAMSHRPFYYQYLLNTFAVHFDDNVQHIEIRALCGTGGLGDLTDLSGAVYSGNAVIETYREALAEFKGASDSARAGFTLKLIVSSLRVLGEDRIEGDVKEALRLKVDNGDLIVGFDIVAEEDPNHRTLDYIDEILELKR